MSNRVAIHVLLGLWLVLLGLLYVVIPPSPDQFEFEYIASEMLRGKRLYSEIVDMNWPGAVAIHLPSAAWHTDVWYPWRLVDYAILLCATLFLGRLVGRHSARAQALLPWVYPALYVSCLIEWNSGQPDVVAGHVLAASACLFLQALERNRLSTQFLCGLTLGAATLVKPVAGIFGPFLLLYLALFTGTISRQRKVAHATVLGGAAIGAIVAGFLPFFLSGTSVSTIVFLVLTYNAAEPDPSLTWHASNLIAATVTFFGRSMHWLTALALWGVSAKLWGQRDNPQCRTLALLLFVAGITSFFIQRRGWLYHFGISYVGLVVLAVFGFDNLCSLLSHRKRWMRVLAQSAIVIASLGFAKKLYHLTPSANLWLHRLDRHTYLGQFDATAQMTEATAAAIAERIRADGGAHNDQTVLVWDVNSSINVLSERPSPTRFYYPPLLQKSGLLFPERQFESQFYTDLERRRPTYCVITPYLEENRRSMPRISDYIDRLLLEYTLIGTYASTRLYRRENSAEPAAPRRPAERTSRFEQTDESDSVRANL